jgi:hypothetical protein
MVDSRSGDDVFEEQANAETVCLHEQGFIGCALRVECAGICEDIAYDSGQLGLVGVKEKDRQLDVYLFGSAGMRSCAASREERTSGLHRSDGPDAQLVRGKLAVKHCFASVESRKHLRTRLLNILKVPMYRSLFEGQTVLFVSLSHFLVDRINRECGKELL